MIIITQDLQLGVNNKMYIIKPQRASPHMTNCKPSGADLFDYKGVNEVYNMDKKMFGERLQVIKPVIPKHYQVVLLKMNLMSPFQV